ncbi:hypothetical protein RCL1_008630 [Eukaryota sp. TZLM3-RCL]
MSEYHDNGTIETLRNEVESLKSTVSTLQELLLSQATPHGSSSKNHEEPCEQSSCLQPITSKVVDMEEYYLNPVYFIIKNPMTFYEVLGGTVHFIFESYRFSCEDHACRGKRLGRGNFVAINLGMVSSH